MVTPLSRAAAPSPSSWAAPVLLSASPITVTPAYSSTMLMFMRTRACCSVSTPARVTTAAPAMVTAQEGRPSIRPMTTRMNTP